MSSSYDIVCHDCKHRLAFAHSGEISGKAGKIPVTSMKKGTDDLIRLEEFLTGHVGHRLETGANDRLDIYYDHYDSAI